MKLVLRSDFRDYYDHWLDPMGEHTLRRYMTDGMDRLAQLRFLLLKGLPPPSFGLVKDLIPNVVRPSDKLVVYTDQRAHCGEGKELITGWEAAEQYPEHLATKYIEDCPGISWRLLQVGMHTFWIEYKNNGGWRSNHGDFITFEIIGTQEGWAKNPETGEIICKLPLFAIDFVLGDRLYAVDFNVAPGIRGTGVEDFLSPQKAAESIKAAYFGGTYQEDVHRYYT